MSKFRKKDFFIFSILIVMILVLKLFIFYWGYVPSASMENTIQTNSFILGNRLSYQNHTPNRGDIIIFQSPLEKHTNLVKRVIGLPGETIEIKNANIYINGKLLEETYLKETWLLDNNNLTYQVPKNCYFVLGDNRNNSFDSRYWETAAIQNHLSNPSNYTFVKQNQIIAKVIWFSSF